MVEFVIVGAGQVIKGWEIGLQGMCLHEKRTITIPSNLAYGMSSGTPRQGMGKNAHVSCLQALVDLAKLFLPILLWSLMSNW